MPLDPERRTARSLASSDQATVDAMNDIVSFLYAPARHARILSAALLLIAGIATLDWAIEPNFALSFLYLFPIMLAGGCLARWQIAALSVFCAVLGEVFSPLPPADATTRMAMMSVAFTGTGLFISELVQKRQAALEHVEELREHIAQREDAEQQLQVLIESSPAAIITVDGSEGRDGSILLANEAAQQLFAPGGEPLKGEPIRRYLSALYAAARSRRQQAFRTHMQCRAERQNGEVFLAAVWFSTYQTLSGPKLAAIIVDLSEDLRDREDLSLNYLLKNSRILIGAMSHEIRNLCGAVSALLSNLARSEKPATEPEVSALQTLLGSLEKIASLELQIAPDEPVVAVDLGAVLDELHVIIEPSCRDAGIALHWEVAPDLPLVLADRYGLLQVFLNIARNSQRAMEQSERKILTVRASKADDAALVRFEDTGPGLSASQDLFRPFQPGADGTGLGLYISRAMLRSFHGELRHEPQAAGCCFAVVLRPSAESSPELASSANARDAVSGGGAPRT